MTEVNTEAKPTNEKPALWKPLRYIGSFWKIKGWAETGPAHVEEPPMLFAIIPMRSFNYAVRSPGWVSQYGYHCYGTAATLDEAMTLLRKLALESPTERLGVVQLLAEAHCTHEVIVEVVDALALARGDSNDR